MFQAQGLLKRKVKPIKSVSITNKTEIKMQTNRTPTGSYMYSDIIHPAKGCHNPVKTKP